MAETEQVIVTRFTSDLSGLQAGIAQAEKGVDGYSKTADATTASTNKLTASVGNLTAKTQVLGEVSKRTADSEKTLATNTEQAGKAAQTATKSTDTLASSTNKLGASGGKLNIFQRAFQGIKGGAQNALTSIKGFFGGIGDGVKNALGGGAGGGGGLSGISSIFTKLPGPIGIAAAAVGGFFLNMTRLDGVKVFLDGIKKGFGNILDQLAAGKFSIDGFVEAFREGANVAKALDALQDKQRVTALLGAEADAQVSRLIIQAKDRTKTEEERIKLLQQAQKIEEGSFSDREANAREEARIALQQFKTELLNQNQLSNADQERIKSVKVLNAETLKGIQELKQSKAIDSSGTRVITGDINIGDELAQAAVDAQTKLAQLQSQSGDLVERAQNRINLITDQGEAQRQADIKKTEEARAREADRIEKVADAEQKLSDLQAQLLETNFLRGASERTKEIEANADKYSQLIEQAKKAAAELRANSPGSDEPEIQAKLSETLKAINEQRRLDESAINKKFDDSDKKALDDRIKGIVDATKDGATLQREAIQAAYDARIEDLNKLIEAEAVTVENGNALKVELATKLASDLAAVQSDADKKAADDAKKAEAEKQQRLDQSVQATQDFADQSGEILGAFAAGSLKDQQEASKALVLLTLDTIEKLVQIQTGEIIASLVAKGAATGGPAGAAIGLAEGIGLSVLIKGIFAAIKSQVQGAYTGEEYVTGKQMWPGKDGHLRRVHEGESIIPADIAAKNRKLIHALHTDDVAGFMARQYDFPKVNALMESDSGQRINVSVMPSAFADKNIVEAQGMTRAEQKRTNALLAELIAHSRPKRISKRYH